MHERRVQGVKDEFKRRPPKQVEGLVRVASTLYGSYLLPATVLFLCCCCWPGPLLGALGVHRSRDEVLAMRLAGVLQIPAAALAWVLGMAVQQQVYSEPVFDTLSRYLARLQAVEIALLFLLVVMPHMLGHP